MTTISNIFYLLNCLTIFSAFGQVDKSISRQLDSLVAIDQKWRGLLRQVENKQIDTLSIDFIAEQIYITDSLNYFAVRQLFNEYGYLGNDRVGQESSHNFWLLVQHADNHPAFQDSVLIQMKVAAEKGTASLTDYAYLLDRVKINRGQLQIYGTQLTLNSSETSYEPKPVIDPDNINDRRKHMGLPPIEDYIKKMNERYYGTIKKD